MPIQRPWQAETALRTYGLCTVSPSYVAVDTAQRNSRWEHMPNLQMPDVMRFPCHMAHPHEEDVSATYI